MKKKEIERKENKREKKRSVFGYFDGIIIQKKENVYNRITLFFW